MSWQHFVLAFLGHKRGKMVHSPSSLPLKVFSLTMIWRMSRLVGEDLVKLQFFFASIQNLTCTLSLFLPLKQVKFWLLFKINFSTEKMGCYHSLIRGLLYAYNADVPSWSGKRWRICDWSHMFKPQSSEGQRGGSIIHWI